MAKQSQLDRAIESLEADIRDLRAKADGLSAVVARLSAQKAKTPRQIQHARTRKPKEPVAQAAEVKA